MTINGPPNILETKTIREGTILDWLRSYRFEVGADPAIATRFDLLADFIQSLGGKSP